MEQLSEFITTFTSGNLFLIFIALMVIILVVLVVALFKMKKEYTIEETDNNEDKDILGDIIADSKMDTVEAFKSEETKPFMIPIQMDYDNIDDYEASEEENAVISTDELEQKTKERMEALGINDNQAMIQKYEDEQEKKAIISYEELLKNAANITVTYTEEKTKAGSPRVNKIEVQDHVIEKVETYISEEEFLRMLKEFRVKLE